MPTKSQNLFTLLRLIGGGTRAGLQRHREIKEQTEWDKQQAIIKARGTERHEAWQEDRQRNIVDEKREQRVKQRAQSFLKILSGKSSYAPEIPDVNIQRQKAYDITGRTAPEDVKFGAKREGLTRAGLSPEQVSRKLGIAPKAPKAPTERQRWAGLSLNPNRTPLEELEYQSLDKTYGSDKKAQEEAKKQRVKLKGNQVKWDKDVRQYVTSSFNRENFPRMIELLDKSGVLLIGPDQLPKGWQKDKEGGKWFEYLMELNRVRNVFGVRPKVRESSVPADLQIFFD